MTQSHATTTVAQLIAEGLAPPEAQAALEQVAETFRIRLTPQMRAVAGAEGIARQFVPGAEELVVRPEELADPIGDHAFSPAPGLTHRYPDRVILAATQTCEVYCRFCFRRETVGSDGALPEADLAQALDHVARHPEIWEVILTGGDPLSLSPRRIAALLARIAAIPHVQVVRFHTRVPVVAPERITPALIEALEVRPAVYVVVHCNHPDELTEAAGDALRRLSRAGVPLLAQTVLLRGVNDRAEVLEALFRGLIARRVKPYYLHHCDLAKGTGHFRTTLAEGQALMAALRGRLSGICLPTYVLDLPGGAGKVPVGPNYLAPGDAAGEHLVTDWQGGVHRYRDPG
ncbi:lysine 2,3-aminomutase [Gemmobacter aquatilis]|uniref:Lysine 2,3-aminomutase n=1 Tax=Gemmobacter aquatilis TaxID=933059 RepID=A0A1H8ISF9_9RHOB|nr:lysine-2,3-aminomutase-like protein [Gemmobacter aquatilis]SEN71352.1 lysine 2,3-aminomutase [Gemmobacter aquatilis]